MVALAGFDRLPLCARKGLVDGPIMAVREGHRSISTFTNIRLDVDAGTTKSDHASVPRRAQHAR
jgi:hypothetical protein